MVLNPIELQLSPFATFSGATLNVGYHDASKGHVVASVEIPSEVIERAVLADLSVEVVVSSDGSIASAAYAKASVNASAKKTIPIDQLVETYLISDNLWMDEATEHDLGALLARLERSVCAVRRAIEARKPATA